MEVQKVSDDELNEFSPADDGFRTVNDEGPLVSELDAKPDGKVDSQGTTLDKVDVLIAPNGAVVDAELGLGVVTVDNLADVGFSIKSAASPMVMQFKDVRVLREFIRRHGMFGVSIAALVNIPDVVKDRLYDQSIWDLRTIDYPVLLDRVQTATDAAAARKRKDEVGKRMQRRETQRVTAEFDKTGYTDAKRVGEHVDDEDGEQFEGTGDA